MHPILFEFGPLSLRWYGLCTALGFLLAYIVFRKRAAKIGLKDEQISSLMFLLFLSGILGARFYYVAWHWTQYRTNPIEIILINHGGLVFYGGFITAVLALIFWARKNKISLAPLMDALAIPLALGHAMGRLGCFMNGCCHGSICDQPWAIRPSSPAEWAGFPLHPTQLYEFFGILFIVAGLLGIEKVHRYSGQVAGTYGILYSILRFVVEYFRGDVPHDILGRYTLAQTVCVAIFLFSWLASARLSFQAAMERKKKLHATRGPSQT